ncbi:MAG: hypothetical protein ACREC5_07585, partial [Thermoplasmata archaeon]
MAPVSAEESLRFLTAIAQGENPPASGPVFESLLRHGAVRAGAQAAEVTAVGEHVRAEITLRAYRLGDRTLEEVSAEMNDVMQELDRIAHSAESFLGDVGPLTPSESLPFMRISAACLAQGDASPEELAEAFRNCWGLVDVLPGDGRDRLLAAALLVRSGSAAGQIYAPILQTVEYLKKTGAAAPHPVTSATLLHLYPEPTPTAPTEAW